MTERTEITLNSIRCKHCNDIIVSTHRHDFKWCKCGKVAVDGGNAYLRRAFQTSPDDDYEELSTYYSVPADELPDRTEAFDE